MVEHCCPGSDSAESQLPLQYEDGPDYCTVRDAQGRDFALTMWPDLMKAMERALVEDIAELSRPPPASHTEEARRFVQSAYDELCVRFSGVHSDDEMDSVLLRLCAALKKMSGTGSVAQGAMDPATVEACARRYDHGARW